MAYSTRAEIVEDVSSRIAYSLLKKKNPLVKCAVIIGREIAMSALREWASALGPEAHSAVAVSFLGKWKTATQMIALTALLASRIRLLPAHVGKLMANIGLPLLVLAAFFTVWSFFEYFSGMWKFMR
jgi:CDP-diacylglycerol--glycerol-3-phosphate 3-phosphatidyltransferase